MISNCDIPFILYPEPLRLKLYNLVWFSYHCAFEQIFNNFVDSRKKLARRGEPVLFSSIHICYTLSVVIGTSAVKVQGSTKESKGILRSRSVCVMSVVEASSQEKPGGMKSIESRQTSGTNTRSADFILKSLLAGGVAGMCSKTAIAPLDRVKILLQAQSKHYANFGVFGALKEVVTRENFLALYRGNGAQMVRIFPYAATQFTSFEIYKQMYGYLLGSNSHIGKFLAGSSAGLTAVAFTYPLDTIRARLAFQVAGEVRYTGILHSATCIFKDEGGIRALYRGFAPTLCGMIPYAGMSFYCFEMFKYLCMKHAPSITAQKLKSNTGGLVLSIPFKLLCGGLAGAMAQSVAYPLDVTRRRMQLAMMRPETERFGTSMVSTIRLIYREDGIMKGLYRGMSINYIRAIPMVAVSFSTYELLKQTLGLDTGVTI